jgi:acetyl esterase/lipase
MSRIIDFLKKLFGRGSTPTPTPPPLPLPLPEFEPDVVYDASNALCKYDVRRPKGMTTASPLAPIIFMIHGGGWQNPLGDKANPGVIANKAAYWLALGYIVISTNYPLWAKNKDGSNNGITPLEEAKFVAKAIAHAQKKVAGGDGGRMTVMGHSAGAHLAALIACTYSMQDSFGLKLFRCVVCLDSGALDIPQCKAIAAATGSKELIDLYEPFGDDPSKWPAMSPIDCIDGMTGPFFMVYSTLRGPGDEKQTTNFCARVKQFGGLATAYPVALSHGEIDDDLGLENKYTTDVNAFIQKHNPA